MRNGWTDRWTDRWTDGQIDGQMDRETDGWMDGQKKWLIEVGAPPKNNVKKINGSSHIKFKIMFNVCL